MKALISMKKNLVILAGLTLALALTACQNSSPSGPRQRANVTAGIMNPATNTLNTNLQWGAIITANGSNFSNTQLSALTGGQTNIGYVSGNVNDPSGTGVLFRGQINQNTGQGTVGIGIWDSQAATGAYAPFYWEMPVAQVSGTANGAIVIIQPQSGQDGFEFNGTFSGTMWMGTFSTIDTNNNLTAIGNFEIPACSIFQC